MEDPNATATAGGTAAAGTTTATAGGGTGGQQQTPAAVARPEWLPEDHWDDTAKSIKPEFGERFKALTALEEAEVARKAAVPADPTGYKIELKLPEGFKPPDGLELKINENDPRIPMLREAAHKNGWSQDQVNQIVALDALREVEAHNAGIARQTEETKKLGANAQQRVEAITNWAAGLKAKGELTPDELQEIALTTNTAAGVSLIEKLMAKASGTVPGITPNTQPKPAQVPQEQRWYPTTPTQQKVS